MIPTLRMLTMNIEAIEDRSSRLADELKAMGPSQLDISIIERSSKAGGGALPMMELPSRCLRIQLEGMSADALEKRMRGNHPPIIGRIEDDAFIMDPRTLDEDDLPIIKRAFEKVLDEHNSDNSPQ